MVMTIVQFDESLDLLKKSQKIYDDKYRELKRVKEKRLEPKLTLLRLINDKVVRLLEMKISIGDALKVDDKELTLACYYRNNYIREHRNTYYFKYNDYATEDEVKIDLRAIVSDRNLYEDLEKYVSVEFLEKVNGVLDKILIDHLNKVIDSIAEIESELEEVLNE